MLKQKFFVVILAILFCACSICSIFIHLRNNSFYDLSLGSANSLNGSTLIISVFADDINYSWNFDSTEMSGSTSEICSYLEIATNFISSEAANYGVKADFIYDYEKHKDLAYHTSFPIDSTASDSQYAESSMNKFISTEIPVDKLRKKYRADNIIYFMFVNTDEYSNGYSCARSYYDGMEYPYEIVFMYYIDSGMKNCPAVYAHEILHTFGAPDLYYPDPEYGISDDFVQYVSKEMPNDIMYYCSNIKNDEYVYDCITNELSILDAYYVGLTNECELVDKYGLGQSQHL